jgi:hypothetical protein
LALVFVFVVELRLRLRLRLRMGNYFRFILLMSRWYFNTQKDNEERGNSARASVAQLR